MCWAVSQVIPEPKFGRVLKINYLRLCFSSVGDCGAVDFSSSYIALTRLRTKAMQEELKQARRREGTPPRAVMEGGEDGVCVCVCAPLRGTLRATTRC